MVEAPACEADLPPTPLLFFFLRLRPPPRSPLFPHPPLFRSPPSNFIANFGRPRPEPTRKGPPRFEHDTPDGYDFFLRLGPLANADKNYFKGDVPFWNDVMAHGNYDEFWKSRNLRPHLAHIKPAVMTVGGWFDAENLFGALETYRHTQANSP